MRVPPSSPHSARVLWEEGMYLAPHHFQAQRRHHELGMANALASVFAFAWGASALEIDAAALANGTVGVVRAQGVLPDGTPFDVPAADAAPPPLALAEHAAPGRDAHTVHLTLPPFRADAGNVGNLGGDALDGDPWADGAPRYVAAARAVADESSGRDTAEVRFAAKNLALALDDAVPPDAVSLPVARVRRDGAGRYVVDEQFVPPCLNYAASPALAAMVRGLLGALDAKGAALAASLPSAPAAAPGGGAPPSAYAGNELATRWLLHAVRSAEAPLRHLVAAGHAHPERLWRELARLAGALCTFSLGARAADLPAYAHDDLGGCFAALERHVRDHLDVVVAPSAIVVPLARVSDVLHAAPVGDPRAFAPNARWFLGVSAALPAAELAARAPQLLKACASRYVLELVRRAYPGLALHHVPAPPAGIAPRPGLTYFEVTRDGPCAQGLDATREFGVYVPDGVPDASLELAVLAAAEGRTGPM